jgi:hypothetical protein
MQSQQVPADSLEEQNRYVFVVINVDQDHSYLFLPAPEKIKVLAKRIEEICTVLTKEKPDAEWIILWREYGVCDGINNHSISDESRALLKSTMKALSKSYPKLTIVAGSTLTRKRKSLDHLNKIALFYNELKPVEAFENLHQNPLIKQYRLQLERIIKEVKNKPEELIKVVANKARVYHNEKEYKHGKVAPFEEVKKNETNTVYQPGKISDKNFLNDEKKFSRETSFTINPHLSLGVSICREGYIDQEYIKGKNFKPLFQCLVNYLNHPYVNSMHARHGLISVDAPGGSGIQYILARGYEKTNIHVEIYIAHPTSPFKKLSKKINPIYPVQFQLLDAVENELKEHKDNLEYCDLLCKIKKILLEYKETVKKTRYDKIDYFILRQVREHSPAFSDKLYEIIDTCALEFKDNRETLCKLMETQNYDEFINMAYESKRSDLSLIIKEVVKSQEYPVLDRFVNAQLPNLELNDIIYSELSFGNIEAKPIVQRLFSPSCDLSKELSIFYRYFNQVEQFNEFIKIARLYFSLLDYTPRFSGFGFFGRKKEKCKNTVLNLILTAIYFTPPKDLAGFYVSLKKELYGVYGNSKQKEEQDKESQYHTSVLQYNFK